MLQSANAPRLVVLSGWDNVATVLTGAAAGTTLTHDGGSIACAAEVPPGHKLALVAIPKGAKIIKFGVPIGSATQDIRAGEHVHAHNVASDYTPTWRGD